MGRLGSDAQNASDVPEEWQGQGVPGSPVVKNLPRSPGDTGLILVQEDPTCLGAAKPVNYCACALEPSSCSMWAPEHTGLATQSQLESSGTRD